MSYTELQVTSNFSFLRGASHPDELAEQAAAYGYRKIAVTDRNTLAGVVRAHVAAKNKGIMLIPAARLDLQNGPSLLAYPTDKDAYARLSGLLTKGNLRTQKGKCELYKEDLYEQAHGIKLVAVPPASLGVRFDYQPQFKKNIAEYREAFGHELYMGAHHAYSGDDAKRLHRLAGLGIPLVATNDVHFHEPSRRQLQDVVTSVREKKTIYNAGYLLHANAERYLKAPGRNEQAFPRLPRRNYEYAGY